MIKLDIQSASALIKFIDNRWQEEWHKIPSFARVREGERKRKWFTEHCLATVEAFFECHDASSDDRGFIPEIAVDDLSSAEQ